MEVWRKLVAVWHSLDFSVPENTPNLRHRTRAEFFMASLRSVISDFISLDLFTKLPRLDPVGLVHQKFWGKSWESEEAVWRTENAQMLAAHVADTGDSEEEEFRVDAMPFTSTTTYNLRTPKYGFEPITYFYTTQWNDTMRARKPVQRQALLF
jgi:hypothetical protein